MNVPGRYVLLPMLLTLAVMGAGCRRGGAGRDSYVLSGGYWTVDIQKADALCGSGGDTVNLLADTGMNSEDNTYFAQFLYYKGMDAYGLGFGTVSSSGEAALTADRRFGGTDFLNGTTVHSSFEMNEYQFIMASRDLKQQEIVTYSFVVEYLDFNVNLYDTAVPATNASFDDSATMLLFGVAYEWMAGPTTLYFVDAKYMDLDVIRIGHAGGEYIDVYAGVKWSVGGDKAHLVVGYRYTDIELNLSGDTLGLSFEGLVVGLSSRF